MTSLDGDPRWQRFNDKSFACACCGQSFGGIFDIGYDHPDGWPHGNRETSGKTILTVGKDRLGTDLCQWDDHCFIRCVTPIPIQGSDQNFCFGPWGSVHPDNFERYLKDDAAGTTSEFQGCFSWLMNDLPGFNTGDPIACNMMPGPAGERPRLFAQEGPLHFAQNEGISFDRLLDIYAASGSDIRPHLLQS